MWHAKRANKGVIWLSNTSRNAVLTSFTATNWGKIPGRLLLASFHKSKLVSFPHFLNATLALWDMGSRHMSYLRHFIWHLIFLYLWVILFYFGSQHWVFIYVKFMQMRCCVWLFVCIPCNGQSCPSFLTWGDWFSLDLSALPLTHVVRLNRACTSQTTWSLPQWRLQFKRSGWSGLASLRGVV